jgi:3-keto-L-gulonate-6-phosphate decarboxylase
MDSLKLSHMKCRSTCFSNVAVQNVVDLLSTVANFMDPTVWLSNLLIGTINYHYSRDKNVQNQSIVHNLCVLAVHPNSDNIIFY